MDDPARRTGRDVLQTVVGVVLAALVLFAVTGAWPPFVAVESGSMEPHMVEGDLIVVVSPERFAGDAARPPGIVTERAADGYARFGRAGDVIVFDTPGWRGSPIIHRASFFVEDGENWYDRANRTYLGGAGNCAELTNCPAPHAGYITRGDTNRLYDQASGRVEPVAPRWVEAKAELRVPWLGWVRLGIERAA